MNTAAGSHIRRDAESFTTCGFQNSERSARCERSVLIHMHQMRVHKKAAHLCAAS